MQKLIEIYDTGTGSLAVGNVTNKQLLDAITTLVQAYVVGVKSSGVDLTRAVALLNSAVEQGLSREPDLARFVTTTRRGRNGDEETKKD